VNPALPDSDCAQAGWWREFLAEIMPQMMAGLSFPAVTVGRFGMVHPEPQAR
jgi:hypothetical protein